MVQGNFFFLKKKGITREIENEDGKQKGSKGENYSRGKWKCYSGSPLIHSLWG